MKNREIKYRAWHKLDKRMYKVLKISLIDAVGSEELKVDVGKISSMKTVLWVKDIELLQYTGLKDKNGTEIYEGDILRVAHNGVEENFKVVFNHGSFMLRFIGRPIDYCYLGSKIHKEKGEVIGNIYENPGLI